MAPPPAVRAALGAALNAGFEVFILGSLAASALTAHVPNSFSSKVQGSDRYDYVDEDGSTIEHSLPKAVEVSSLPSEGGSCDGSEAHTIVVSKGIAHYLVQAACG